MIVYHLCEPKALRETREGYPVLSGFVSLSENLAERWLALGHEVTVSTSVGYDLDTVRAMLEGDHGTTHDMVTDAEDKREAL